MSRGETIRQTPRGLPLTESTTNQKAQHKRRSVNEKRTPSHKSSVGLPKQLSLQDFVRVAPSYNPNVEQEKKEKQRSKFTRSRIAEVFTFNRQSSSVSPRKISRELLEKSGELREKSGELREKSGRSDEKLQTRRVSGGGGGSHRQTTSVKVDSGRDSWKEPVRAQFHALGGAASSVDLVHTAVINFKSLRNKNKSLDDLGDTMTTTRGPNVSVLHLRGTSEPWESPITTFTDTGGSLRSVTKGNQRSNSSLKVSASNGTIRQQSFGSNVSGTLPASYRRRDSGPSAGPVTFLIASSASAAAGSNNTLNSSSGNCQRELSPVRWCDREVDGVYLGRSGWVQVQQHSLDDKRRDTVVNSKRVISTVTTTTSTLPTRIKLANYHSKSEPGKFPIPGIDEKPLDKPRPAYLPLPLDLTKSKELIKTPSPLTQEYESMSPPPITPIISPPPAFQDPTSNEKFKSVPRPRTLTGKPPFLPRSNTVVDCESPPKSPPSPAPHRNQNTRQINWPKKLTPSPVSTPQGQLYLPQTKSLEDNASGGTRRTQFQRLNESSSSSSSASFGFRSLDSTVARNIIMPKLNETDSSIDGYDDEDEKHRRAKLENFYRVNGEKVSPNTVRNRSLPRSNVRRTPANDNKKPNNRSSSSDSSSSCERRSPNVRRPHQRYTNSNRQYSGEGTNSWDGRRVRRSRSLQLPEKRSPGAPVAVTPSSSGGSREHLNQDYMYYPSKSNGQYTSQPLRTGVKINGESTLERTRRQMQRNSKSEEHKYEELRREVEEEARIVTEFLSSTRTRAAARDLLLHRYLNRPEEPVPVRMSPSREDGAYSIHVIGGNTNMIRRPSSQQRKPLQRGATTPTVGVSNIPTFSVSPSTPNPCNPTSCDFWPHCSHRDNIYSPTPQQKASSPSSSNSMRSSQSYPSSVVQNDKIYREDRNGKESVGPSTCSSPASFDEHDKRNIPSTRSSPASMERNTAKCDNRRGKISPEQRNHEYKYNKSQPNRSSLRSNGQSGKTKNARKSKFENVDIDGYVSFPNRKSLGTDDGQRYTRSGTLHRVSDNDYETSNIRGKRTPPGFYSNRGNSSNSSSSSDVWVTTSDRASSKSPRPQKSSGASTPLDDNVSGSSKSDMLRPGSAPAEDIDDKIALDAQHRSLSLPKSFLSDRYGFRQSKQSGLFPWRRQAVGSPSITPASLRPPTPEVSRTAPATPVRELNGHNRDQNRSGRYTRSSSTPLLDDPVDASSDWDISRQWPDRENVKELTAKSSSTLPHQRTVDISQRALPGTVASESVLQKFRKSFSLRFHKKEIISKDENDDVDEMLDDAIDTEQKTLDYQSSIQLKDDVANSNGDQKFRFGPLVWRSSKERKKGKKAARNAKCNSGDSGIQIESTLNIGGDSSESHDTDQHDEPLDELDSPPVVRRREPSNDKPSRPQSEVINQILIDKFKADLQWRSQARGPSHRNVRRTNSDLSGQRLYNWELRNNYRRMLSTPSPIKLRPPRLSPRKPSPEAPIVLRNKRLAGRAHLRRSISQPLGLNELSPIMRRQPANMRNNVLSEDEHGGGHTSDDEVLSDSESSVTSLPDRKKSFEQAMDDDVVVLAEAVWDHISMEPEELAFRAGDVIEVLDTVDRDWWWGSTGEHCGWFPSAFVRLRVSQEDTVEDCLAAMASGVPSTNQLRRRTSISLLSNDQVRSSVVRELVNTERDFVKVLRDVSEGYIAECKRRTDMFTDEQVYTMFGNLEDLLKFQEKFLQDLEARVDRDTPHRSCVGEIFLQHRAGFRMYSEYCNSHPLAIATLQELYQHNSYSKFFEACRLMRGLIEIPLDGYLLTPVQRICKYPLQLAELLKYTKTDHPDFTMVKEALETMRGVAVLINERKRRMESLEKLAAWQHRVEGWEGEDLIETSSQLIHQCEAVRVTTGMWTSNVTIFLFDHQLIYCKKDLLKRNTYVYKGRICMDTSEIVNLPDGKDPYSGATVRNAVKIYSGVRDKWLLFCCRSADEKLRWLEALDEERRLVVQDRQEGLEFPIAARQLAKLSARCKRRPPSKPRNKTYKREQSQNERQTHNIPNQTNSKVGKKVGTWFTFGAGKKGSRLNLRSGSVNQHIT